MSLTFRCVKCNQHHEVPDKFAGKVLKCITSNCDGRMKELQTQIDEYLITELEPSDADLDEFDLEEEPPTRSKRKPKLDSSIWGRAILTIVLTSPLGILLTVVVMIILLSFRLSLPLNILAYCAISMIGSMIIYAGINSFRYRYFSFYPEFMRPGLKSILKDRRKYRTLAFLTGTTLDVDYKGDAAERVGCRLIAFGFYLMAVPLLHILLYSTSSGAKTL